MHGIGEQERGESLELLTLYSHVGMTSLETQGVAKGLEWYAAKIANAIPFPAGRMLAVCGHQGKELSKAQVLDACPARSLLASSRPLRYVDVELRNELCIDTLRRLAVWHDAQTGSKEVAVGDVHEQQLLDEARHARTDAWVHRADLSRQAKQAKPAKPHNEPKQVFKAFDGAVRWSTNGLSNHSESHKMKASAVGGVCGRSRGGPRTSATPPSLAVAQVAVLSTCTKDLREPGQPGELTRFSAPARPPPSFPQRTRANGNALEHLPARPKDVIGDLSGLPTEILQGSPRGFHSCEEITS